MCPDLSHFDHIVPCGIEDAPVTSIERLLQPPDAAADLGRVQSLLLQHLAQVLEVDLLPSADDLTLMPIPAGTAAGSQLDGVEPMSLRGENRERQIAAVSEPLSKVITVDKDGLPPKGFEWGGTF